MHMIPVSPLYAQITFFSELFSISGKDYSQYLVVKISLKL